MKRKTFYVLFFFALLPSLLLAGSGRIKGKVTDLSTGEALIGANVFVDGTSYGAATDADGEFTIINLDAGVYTVKASYLGFKTVTVTSIRVNTDLTTEVGFQLPSDDISVGTVMVIAEKPLIQKDATSSIRNVTGEDIRNLPVRGVTDIIALQAGVVKHGDDIHIRGSRATEVGYTLEGVSISNPFTGGRMVTLSNDAVEELQVESGGFTAEYGGSNAGIIRTQLKSGTSDYHFSIEHITDNLGFQKKDDFLSQDKRLGAYWYGNNETSFSLSGPVVGNTIKVFYNLNYDYDHSQNKTGYSGYDLGFIGDGLDKLHPENNDSLHVFYPAGVIQRNKRQVFTHSGTVTMDFNPVTVRLAGTFTDGERDPNLGFNGGAGVFQIANSRHSNIQFNNGSFSGKITHVLGDNLYYELGGGLSFSNSETLDPFLGDQFWLYGDSVANADAGVNWVRNDKERRAWSGLTPEDTRYIQPVSYNIFGFFFDKEGGTTNNYRKNERQSLSGRFDLTYLPNKNHNIKFGGEFKQHTIRNWSTRRTHRGAAASLSRALKQTTAGSVEEEKAKILYASGVNNYGYDIFGEKTDESGFYAPHKPIEAGVYLQDKIEFDDIILNVGLRYDYFDMDNLKLTDPTRPELAFTNVAKDGKLLEAGFTDVEAFSSLSPRLSVSFPVTDRTVFHAGFGKYVQQPSLNQAYLGYHSQGYEYEQSNFFSAPTGPNLRPVRKTHYEVGFRQQLTDFMAVDITGYYDDIKGQIFFAITETDKDSPYSSYNTKANGDFSTTKGVEIQLTMRRYNRLSGSASLSFQDARGTGSFPNGNGGIVGSPIDGVTVFTPNYVSPLTFSRPFKGNVFLDYRFGADDGPAVFDQFGLSVLATFSSGHPFTRGFGGANAETDSRFRQPLEPLNASLTPSTLSIDLKIDKTFSIFDNLAANIYVRVLNLFDRRNVNQVFLRSGAADDDGYISDPDLGGKLIETFGPVYESLYRATSIDYSTDVGANTSVDAPNVYGDARQILLGIRLEY